MKAQTPLQITLILLVGLARSAAEPVGRLSSNLGQLSAPIEWIETPDAGDQRYMVQRSRDGKLLLTPNESFFPRLGLTASGDGAVDDVAELNGGNSFASIGQWDADDRAEWGLWIEQPGEVEVHLWMSGAASRSKFSLTLGADAGADAGAGDEGVSVSFSPKSSETGEPRLVASQRLEVDRRGRHSLILTCENNDSRSAALHWIEVSGPAAENGAVLRKRWRPAAAHTKFSSSREPERVRLWIMEMDAVPAELGFYSPITTPFGYYGPTWQADGTVNTSFNFSLWSFGRGQAEPPVEQLSHLLAIGNRDARFGGFDHEGTGVKIRDWEPLEGRQGQRQALALRLEPGEIYDTYYSYFYAADEKRWRLFGAGRKFNKGKPAKSLWVGSFVEVPGPPPRQRTGAYARTMRYRGWVMDENHKWYPLDRMSNGNINKETGLTHTRRGVTDDGWFFLETGGWAFREPPQGDFVTAQAAAPSARNRIQVDYLDADDLAFLKTVPCEIEATRIERSSEGDRARVSFRIRNLGEDAEVTVHHGPDEALTLADRWPESASVPQPGEGDNQFILEGLDPGAALKVRLLLKNREGQFWSKETLR